MFYGLPQGWAPGPSMEETVWQYRTFGNEVRVVTAILVKRTFYYHRLLIYCPKLEYTRFRNAFFSIVHNHRS